MRYSLRTLLIVLAIAGISLGWLTSQMRMDAKRKAVQRRLEVDGVALAFYQAPQGHRAKRFIEGDKSRGVSLFRRWLGDEEEHSILFLEVPSYARAVVEAFPESDIYFPVE